MTDVSSSVAAGGSDRDAVVTVDAAVGWTAAADVLASWNQQ